MYLQNGTEPDPYHNVTDHLSSIHTFYSNSYSVPIVLLQIFNENILKYKILYCKAGRLCLVSDYSKELTLRHEVKLSLQLLEVNPNLQVNIWKHFIVRSKSTNKTESFDYDLFTKKRFLPTTRFVPRICNLDEP